MQALGSVYDTMNGGAWLSRRRQGTRSYHDGSDLVVFNELFEPFMFQWCNTHMEVMVGKGSFLDSYKSIARERWYENMRSARGARYTQLTRASYKVLVECWELLGQALGLDEVKARDRFETRHARICSWVPCPHHKKALDKPLQVCKGCKETRYCSRECQMK